MRLKDRVAVVTGGGSGIGRAICQAFVDEGCAVVIADIDNQSANRTADEITKYGGVAIPVKMDVTNPDDVHACVAQTIKAFGRIHILVNNAGVEGHRANIWEADDHDWRRTIEVHLFGNYNCT